VVELIPFFLLVFTIAPWILATARDHEHHGAILALTLLFGWTGIGWLAALAWALDAPKRLQESGWREAFATAHVIPFPGNPPGRDARVVGPVLDTRGSSPEWRPSKQPS
jgi:hypothetical protein